MPANNQLQSTGAISYLDIEEEFNLNNTSGTVDIQYYVADDTDPWIGTIALTTDDMELEDYYGSSPDTGRIIVDEKNDDDGGDYQNGYGSLYTNFLDPENPHDPGYLFGHITNTTPGTGLTLEGIYSEWYWDAHPGGRMFIIGFRNSSLPDSNWDELYLRFERGAYSEVNITFYRSDASSGIQSGSTHSNHEDTYYYVWYEEHSGSEGTNVVNAQHYMEEASDNDYKVFYKFKKT